MLEWLNGAHTGVIARGRWSVHHLGRRRTIRRIMHWHRSMVRRHHRLARGWHRIRIAPWRRLTAEGETTARPCLRGVG